MAIRAIALSAAVCAALGTPAWSDSPTVPLDLRLSALLGQEHAALKDIAAGHAERILSRPEEEGAAEVARYDADWLLKLPEPRVDEEMRCLAHALYFEARGESIEGQFAVAEVILNRVDSPRYPGSICEVVYQGSSTPGGCQFSFTCDGQPETIAEPAAYDLARRIAYIMKDGAERGLTQGATHFHTTAVSPRWARVFPQTAQLGTHLFYRQPSKPTAH